MVLGDATGVVTLRPREEQVQSCVEGVDLGRSTSHISFWLREQPKNEVFLFFVLVPQHI